MSKLLYIISSPRHERSYSTSVTNAFIDAYKAKDKKAEIITLDLFKTALPEFNAATIDARFATMNGHTLTPEQRKSWGQIESVIDLFKSADKYVFAVPMWNFGIPYKLKHLIDVITQPNRTFSFSPDTGYKGLVTGKPVFLAYARGGEYPAGSPGEAWDLQKKYLELALHFIGFTDLRSIVIEPTLAKGSTFAHENLETKRRLAETMAKDF